MQKVIFKRFLSAAVDVVLPPQSLLELGLRGQNLGEAGTSITFLDEPCCASCGFPFAYDVGAGAECGDCLARPPAYDKARAAFIYDEVSRRSVLAFKHGGRTENLKTFAAHMRRVGRTSWPKADFIIPVPLHPSRLIKRKFNQSALLASKLSRLTGVPFMPDILFRTRATPSQGAQTAAGRRRNVQGAFNVPAKVKPLLKGRHVVLIDDVMTTGATLNACARTLRRAGASYIDVITLARSVRQKTTSFGDTHGQN